MQNLKAVEMGVVAAIAFFWTNRPNPAMQPVLPGTTQVVPFTGPHQTQTPLKPRPKSRAHTKAEISML
jgi:hypothetical protein